MIIKDISMMEKKMDMVLAYILMETNTKVNLKMMYVMDKVSRFLKMVINMKAISFKTNFVV